jgi:sugar fermentation stimulation protein
MKWDDPRLVPGIFRERLHRFGAFVTVAGRREYCHVTNSGRLRELLRPGVQVGLVDHGLGPAGGAPRKTRYAVRLVRHRGRWVCIEANLAPKLLEEAWREGRVPGLQGYDRLRAEVPLNPHTRFDFLAEHSGTGARAWVEVKCATLVDSRGTGFFPDAPSERASKHLAELAALAREPRTRCFVFFILQNPRGKAVAPKADTDPRFALQLRKAREAGVGLRAFHAKVMWRGCLLDRPLPVLA